MPPLLSSLFIVLIKLIILYRTLRYTLALARGVGQRLFEGQGQWLPIKGSVVAGF